MLKHAVRVLKNKEKTTVEYAMWAIEVPNLWLDNHPNFDHIFNRTGQVKNWIPSNDEEFQVYNLLKEQGCFEEEEKSVFTGLEVQKIFERVVTTWYSQYYKHPIWNELISGCSRNHLITWLIQNYHLSRSAGVTDSRCVTYFPKKEMREYFKQNAIEEFWHCDAFYFVNHSKLSVDRDAVKGYLPLPASIAFDQQMLFLAENDPLAYIMVAYYQESSARFITDCKEFYATMEAKYDLEGFFTPWVNHLMFDFEYDHADRYARMFLDNGNVSREDLLASFKNAAFAIGYLFQACNEILNEPISDEVLLRSPIDKTESTYLLKRVCAIQEDLSALLRTKNFCAVIDRVVPDYGRQFSHDLKLRDDEMNYIRNELSQAAFRALGFSYQHDEIQIIGGIARDLIQTTETPQVRPAQESEWIALRNYILESAHQSNSFMANLYCLDCLFRHLYQFSILPKEYRDKSRKLLESEKQKDLFYSYLNSSISLFEFFRNFIVNKDSFYLFDLFKD